MRYYENQVGSQSPQFDGLANGCNHAALNEGGDSGQSVDLDIVHELGANISSVGSLSKGDETSVFTKTDTSFNLAVTGVGTNNKRPQVRLNLSAHTTGNYLVSFYAVVNSGTPIITTVYSDGGHVVVDYIVVNGYNSMELNITDSEPQPKLNFDGRNLFDIEVTNMTIKPISLPTGSSILYYDAVNKEHIAMSADGSIGKKIYEAPFGDPAKWIQLGTKVTINNNKAVLVDAEGIDVDKVTYADVPLPSKMAYMEVGVSNYIEGVARVANGANSLGIFNIDSNGVHGVFRDMAGGTTLMIGGKVGHPTTLNIDYVFYREFLPTSSTFTMDTSFSNFVALNVVPTQADLDSFDANKNDLMNMHLGKPTVGTYSFAKVNMKHYYPCNEGIRSGKFLQDVTVDLGSDLSRDTITYNTGDEISNITVHDPDAFDIAITTVGASLNLPSFNALASSPSEIGKIMLTSFDIVLHSGTCRLRAYNAFGHYNQVNIDLETGSYGFISEVLVDNKNIVRLDFNGKWMTFDASITNWNVRELSAKEIQGYTDNCRLLRQNTNYGSSNLLIEQDASGRPIASITETGEVFLNNGQNINYGFVVGDTASIRYTCSGMLEDVDADGNGLGTFTQRTEERILEYGVGELTRYQIDGVFQSYSPALPQEIPLVLNETAFIGHPDKITSINSPDNMFQYFSEYGAIL